ncbi:uncharacterized protein LOC143020191 [Oratosquilla oratoria]|uniref:uncharacterized protein LOC143020191 n=1 Tax=Oratosquilla oratoria TaxID=337810 RepID=UPI003F757AAA
MVYGALSGKALDTFIVLSESQSSDYYVLRYNILQAYQLVPEAYRQQFKKCRKSNQETYVEYFRRKLRLFTWWVESEEAHVDLEKLQELILMEDIRNNIPPDVRANLDQRGKPIDSETRGSTLTGGRSYCKYCKKPGHHVDDCFKLQQKKSPLQGSPSLSINVAEQSESFLEPSLTAVSPSVVPDNSSPPMLSTFEPFCSSGSVALDQGSPPTSIKLLRDTLITKNVAALIGAYYTGNWVLVNGLTGGPRIPICQVYSRSDVRTGYAQVGVVDKLPVEGVSLLIGNYLAGGTMLHNAVISSCPSAENNTSQLEADIPGIFPACAVTRSMSRRVDTEISEHKEDAHNRFDIENDSEGDNVTTLDSFGSSPVTRSKLIHLQKDPELASCFCRAISEEEAKSESNCYYLSSDILMRKFRPTDSPWSVRHQIMVPNPLWKEILGIAHDGIGGHLGVAGKPHPSVKPFPLQPIPVIEEPFGRIVIDCIGPLPKTPRGNQFLFTMIDCATRYPPASQPPASQPRMCLGLQPIIPNPKGVVERFHQIFKRMLRTYCLEFGKDWDEGVDLLLFTVRDSVQESLGFSPFQLIYGHEVRGPLKPLKESWLLENSVTPLVLYVAKFRERLEAAVRMAHARLKSAQIKMKQQFDKKHRVEHREFRVGDKVLAFLPVQTHPFQAKYDGPFQIVDRSGLYTKVDNSTILYDPNAKLGHLSNDQASDISSLLTDYSDISSDHPHPCSAVDHNIETNGARPISQRPYRLNAFKKE